MNRAILFFCLLYFNQNPSVTVSEEALSSVLHFSLIRWAFIYMTGLIISNLEQKLNQNKTGEVLLLSLIPSKSVHCCHYGEFMQKWYFTKPKKSNAIKYNTIASYGFLPTMAYGHICLSMHTNVCDAAVFESVCLSTCKRTTDKVNSAQLGRTNKMCVFVTVGAGTGPDQ